MAPPPAKNRDKKGKLKSAKSNEQQTKACETATTSASHSIAERQEADSTTPQTKSDKREGKSKPNKQRPTKDEPDHKGLEGDDKSKEDKKDKNQAKLSSKEKEALLKPDFEIVDGRNGPEFTFSYPLYGVQWMDQNTVLVGGGGGSRFGIPNRLVVLRQSASASKWSLALRQQFEKTVWTMSPFLYENHCYDGLIGHADCVESVSLNSKGSGTLRCPPYFKLRINVSESMEVHCVPECPSRKHLALSSCRSVAVVAQDDNSILCLECFRGKAPASYCKISDAHVDRINDLSLASWKKNSFLILSAGDDRTMCLWRLSGPTSVTPSDGEPSSASSSSVVKLMAKIATTDIRKDKCVIKFCKLNRAGTAAYVVTTGMGASSYVSKFDIVDKNKNAKDPTCELVSVKHKKITSDSVTAFCLSRSEGYLCCGDNEGALYVLDSITLAVLFRRRGFHDAPITAVDIWDETRRILSTDLQATLKITTGENFGLWAVVGRINPIVRTLIVLLILAALLCAYYFWKWSVHSR